MLRLGIKLDGYGQRKSSLLRVRQLLILTISSTNKGNVKEGYDALSEAVKEAHGIELFMEAKAKGLPEFERESRRRTLWNLYVDSPSSQTTTSTSNPDAPTVTTNVIWNSKLCQCIPSFVSTPSKKSERLDPIAIAAQAQKFQAKYLDVLPSSFRLVEPDTSFDYAIPTLPMKRANSWLGIYGVFASMHKEFFHVPTPNCMSKEELQLAEAHRDTLVNASVHHQAAVVQLHQLLGGGAHLYSMLSMGYIEGCRILGMCLVASKQDNKPPSPSLHILAHESFSCGIKMLETLSLRSPPARKCIVILKKLQLKLSQGSSPVVTPSQVQDADVEDGALSRDQDNFNNHNFMIAEDLNFIENEEWEPIPMGNDLSWFLENDAFFDQQDSGDFEGFM